MSLATLMVIVLCAACAWHAAPDSEVNSIPVGLTETTGMSAPPDCGCANTTGTEHVAFPGMGTPVPFTWQLGTGSATVDQMTWTGTTHTPMAMDVLRLQVTVEALTGQADFDTETWDAMTADGRLLRTDEALDPTGASPDTWKRLNTGERHQGWVTFTVPYGSTDVYYTILQQRLAVFSAPVEPRTTASTSA